MLIPKNLLDQLPIGYMISIPNNVDIPKNFIKVDGQKLLKNEYKKLFLMMKHIVNESEDYFTLPNEDSVKKIFTSSSNNKIILKIK